MSVLRPHTKLIFNVGRLLLCVHLFVDPKHSMGWGGHETVSMNDESAYTELHYSRLNTNRTA